MKRYTILADTSGAVWLETEVNELEVEQLIKEYERRGIYLSDYYSKEEIGGNS